MIRPRLLPVLLALATTTASAEDPVKVFLLIGQSNMQGKGKVSHLADLVESDAENYGHLKKGNNWVERDDVEIHWEGRNQKLTVGHGAPQNDRFGPELGFGHIVGDAFDEPVLVIKAAWGGRSLAVDFRSPSSGGHADGFDVKNPTPLEGGATGRAYMDTFIVVKQALEQIGDGVKKLKGRPHQFVGAAWFQGWNDLIDSAKTAEYEANLKNFISDLRRDLDTPELPFVIVESGQGGVDANAKMMTFRKAQAAPAKDPEFKDTVAHVPTAHFIKADPSFDGGYHFSGNAENFYQIGKATGEGMLQLLDKTGALGPSRPEPREYFNTDRTKSFTATLVSYNLDTEKVTVRMSTGRNLTFDIATLSEDDQKYVKAQSKRMRR